MSVQVECFDAEGDLARDVIILDMNGESVRIVPLAE